MSHYKTTAYGFNESTTGYTNYCLQVVEMVGQDSVPCGKWRVGETLATLFNLDYNGK